jgi:serine/threonine protein kinase
VRKRIEKLAGTLTDRYNVVKTIHDGGDQCRIKLVQSKECGKMYVMKIQAKDYLRADSEKLFRRGLVRLMNMGESKHVVKLHNCFEDSHFFYTLQEPCEGGTLMDFLKLLREKTVDPQTREKEVREVMHEVLLALDHFHKQGLVHKDVKLENLMFKQRATLHPPVPLQKQTGLSIRPTLLKLIDFDSVQEHKAARSRLVLGTDGYIAPEAYLGDACPKSDVFSAGVIMYELMTGGSPFDSDIFDDAPGENYVGSRKMAMIRTRVLKSKVHFGSSWKNMDTAKSFCKALLDFDESKRMTAEEALKHPWMATLTRGEVKETRRLRIFEF